MQYLFPALVVLGFIGNAFLMKHFFKQLLQKLQNQVQQTPNQITVQKQSQPLSKFPWQKKEDPLMDPRSPNNIPENDLNDINFDETMPMPGVMPDIKFDTEGGDSQVPPGFETT